VPEPIAAVVLAAGLSTRFGGDKLLYPYAGKPLAAHIADTLVAMPVSWRIAIVPPAPSPREALFRATELGAAALLVCLADMPNITAAHLKALLAAADDSDAVATGFDNARGPPAVFRRRLFPELAAVSGHQGAKHLLASATLIMAPPGLERDFDTPSDFNQP